MRDVVGIVIFDSGEGKQCIGFLYDNFFLQVYSREALEMHIRKTFGINMTPEQMNAYTNIKSLELQNELTFGDLIHTATFLILTKTNNPATEMCRILDIKNFKQAIATSVTLFMGTDFFTFCSMKMAELFLEDVFFENKIDIGSFDDHLSTIKEMNIPESITGQDVEIIIAGIQDSISDSPFISENMETQFILDPLLQSRN